MALRFAERDSWFGSCGEGALAVQIPGMVGSCGEGAPQLSASCRVLLVTWRTGRWPDHYVRHKAVIEESLRRYFTWFRSIITLLVEGAP
jgi:hypothetical protein